jgi:hypothetical protein
MFCVVGKAFAVVLGAVYTPSIVRFVCVLSPVRCSDCVAGVLRVFFCRGMS